MSSQQNLDTINSKQAAVSGSRDRPSRTKKAPGVWQVRAMGLGLVLLGLFLAYLLLRLWPAGLEDDTKGSALQTVHLWRSSIVFDVTLDVRLILLVMVAGGLGSFIHTATSFGDYVGNDKLSRTWFWWYILRPFIGMALALIFYLVIRGGFLSVGTEAGKINPYGITALAGLVGMFSKQATDKLDEVFNTLFRTASGEGDSKRKDNLTNPVPSISDFEPKSVEPRTNNLIVNVKGTGFAKGAVVRINGTNRDTDYVDETQINAKLLPEDVEKEGELEITIFNPPPGGGESTSMKLKIAPKTE
jgi:hypothetical protein